MVRSQSFEKSAGMKQGATAVAATLCSLFVVMTAAKTHAQSAALANDPATLAASADLDGKPFLFSGQFLVETARTADESQPASYSGSYLGVLSAVHRKTGLTSTLRASYSQEYSYDRDDGTNGGVENPSLAVAKAWRAGKSFESTLIDSVSLSLSGSAGLSKESRRRTLLGTAGVSATISKRLDRFNVRESVGYTRSFFNYDIRDNGVVNSPNTFRSITSVYCDVNDRLSIGGEFTFGYAVSFQGVGRTTELSVFSADYAFTDTISGSLGVSTERGTLEPDGTSNRVRFFAPEAAQYFVDLILLL